MGTCKQLEASRYSRLGVCGVTLLAALCCAAFVPEALDEKELINALWLRGCTDAYYK